MNGPLSGVRVLDLSNVVSGPMAVQLLADQGADVIKIEQPEGDACRNMGANRNGIASMFAVLNRNKRSVVLNMQHDSAKELFKELAATADVLSDAQNDQLDRIVDHEIARLTLLRQLGLLFVDESGMVEE